MNGGNDTQTSTQTTSLPPWLRGYVENFLGQGQNVANLPYQQYQGQRVADLAPVQTNAIQGLSGLTNGTPSTQAASSMLTRTLNGGYSNPFAGQQVSGGGQYSFAPLSGGENQYIGENPYFRQMRAGALDDVVNNYQTAIAPEITRVMNLSGNLGGSAHLNALSNAQRNLMQQLGRVSAGMSGEEYNRSAQLAESGLNRNLNAGQFNASLGNTAFENSAQRNLNAGQFNANLGSNAHENERNRQMGAVSGATGLLGAQGQALMNALQGGNIERSQLQDLLNSQYGDFQDWRNYPDSRVNLFGNLLGSVLGRSGTNSTSTQNLPGPDRVSQGMGILSLLNLFGGR